MSTQPNNTIDAAFDHVYRLRALTDALKECVDIEPSTRTGLAAIAFSESSSLLECLTAISERSGE
jgi:hypothetical protein